MGGAGAMGGAGITALGVGVTKPAAPRLEPPAGAVGTGLLPGAMGASEGRLPEASTASAGSTMGGGAGGLGSVGAAMLGVCGTSGDLGMSNTPAPTATASKATHKKLLDRDSPSSPALDKLWGGGGSMSAVATATWVMTEDRSALAAVPGVCGACAVTGAGACSVPVGLKGSVTGLPKSLSACACTNALSGDKPSKTAIFRAAVALTDSL